MSLRDAKVALHESPAWIDVEHAAEALYDEILDALDSNSDDDDIEPGDAAVDRD